MTTIAVPRETTPMPRLLAAFRLQYVVPSNLVYIPALVFVLAWLVGIAITVFIHLLLVDRDPVADPMYGGASQAALWTLAAMAAVSVSQTMPFAMALSYSRRSFVLGAYLAFAASSVGFGLAYVMATLVERVTGGFGIHAYQFDTPFIADSAGLAGAFVLAAVLCITVMMIAFLFAAIYRRVGMLGFWTTAILVVAAVGIAFLLVVQQIGLDGLGRWAMDQTSLTIAGWLLLVAVPVGALGYAILRKSTVT